MTADDPGIGKIVGGHVLRLRAVAFALRGPPLHSPTPLSREIRYDTRRSGDSQFRKFRFDCPIHIVLAEIVRDTDGIFDCVRIGATVADNRYSIDSQQRRPSILGIIQAPPESPERFF